MGAAMATIFNEADVPALAVGRGAHKQALLHAGRVPGTGILLDRIALDPGGTLSVSLPVTSIGWLQGLSDEATLVHGAKTTQLTDAHVCSLPPRFAGELRSAAGATLLYGEIPNARRFDAELMQTPLRVSDWTREPVLDSEHDARKRIYLITPKLFGTKAVKGEMIIYPPGTAAANHHHDGAEHFMYVLRGRGTVYANERPFAVRQGDMIYYPDRERHYLQAAKDEELVFAEYFAPAEFRTVWVDESQICTWHPTGRDMEGRMPVREIKAHSSAEVANPADV
jgi:quercetin dioxygenase-like cupin family protein